MSGQARRPEEDSPDLTGWEVVDTNTGKVVNQFWGEYSLANATLWRDNQAHQAGWHYNLRQAARTVDTWVDRGVVRAKLPDSDTAFSEGKDLGTALATIIGIGANADFQSLSVLGMMLAELKGYRDMRTGNQFVTGLVAGFRAVVEGGAPRKIAAPDTPPG